MTTTATIKGMHCKACESLVRMAAEDLGVKVVDARVLDPEKRTGEVTVEDDGTVDWRRFKEEVEAMRPEDPYELIIPQP